MADLKKTTKSRRGLFSSEVLNWLIRMLQGAVAGAGAIVPGVSGGVICVMFGIYQPLLELFSHPWKTIKQKYNYFLPIFLGVASGFFLLARFVRWLFQTSAIVALALFVGLITGTLPSLFKNATKTGSNPKNWTVFSISLVLIYSVFLFFQSNIGVINNPGGWWFFVSGVIWGFSLVIPGLSSSSILLFLGMYEHLAAGVAALDPAAILPLMAGIGLTISFAARIVSFLFKKYSAAMNFFLLGIVVAATLLIVPTNLGGFLDILTALLSFSCGLALAWGFSRLQKVKSNRTTAE